MQTFATKRINQKTPNTVKAGGPSFPQVRSILRAGARPKLKIGAVNDPAEIEADRVADQVMRVPDTAINNSSESLGAHNSVGNILRRKCMDCEDEVQRKEIPEIRMKGDGASAGGGAASPEASRAINSLGVGTPLPASERSFFEPRFGRDLSNIRLHTGGIADVASKSINARAFSLGNSIAFANGEYRPGTHSGRNLMAHEITHTLQGSNNHIRRKKESDDEGGEKFSAVWNVGAVDAMIAKKMANEAIKKAKATGLSGAGDGPMDAWRHCYWNCRMTERIGKSQAKLVADGHEIYGSGSELSHKMDYHNNYEGRKLLKGECAKKTWEKLKSGDLRIIKNGKLVPSKAIFTEIRKDKGYGYEASYSASQYAADGYYCSETFDDDGENCKADHQNYKPSKANCDIYAKNSYWLPDAYVHNAKCACLHTPNTKTANCVRNKLQQRLRATSPRLKKEAAATKLAYKVLRNPTTRATYEAYVQLRLTKLIYDDHVYAYNNCCCTAGPAKYPAWMAVTSIPVYPCSAVGTSIRFGGGSCHGTWGCW